MIQVCFNEMLKEDRHHLNRHLIESFIDFNSFNWSIDSFYLYLIGNKIILRRNFVNNGYTQNFLDGD